ncbi:GmrSD restriction endonuclease domain-containing protein [Vreelandella piezotolerans]|uniref:GmrSD restriction endonuclease domain-containing protein n=1 Tax=Vreelandella piezotolerans TaxID=2609667 RepID=UPI001C6259BA|nr:DUF262 domain-containing protein [Halomonas piezotolerans]
MKISTLLDQIEIGQIALPEFQRGYVWNRDQVRGLVRSLYKRYPVGSLLAWITDSSQAKGRGVSDVNPGQQVKMLLDGQQRMTSLYGIIKGEPPAFFDGDANAFTGLYFHAETEEFSFYMASKMQGNPLWVDVTRLMKEGVLDIQDELSDVLDDNKRVLRCGHRLNRLREIGDIDVHIEDVSGSEMTLDVVVDIFNRVNSGGRKLSKGDLALARICSVEPNARSRMRKALDEWSEAGFEFSLDWLLRSVTTIATGDARFSALHDLDASTFNSALQRAINHTNTILDLIGARLGLDHQQVLTGHFAFPILVRFLDEAGGGAQDLETQNKILFWYVQTAIWGRYSGSTESVLSRDLNILLDAGPAEGLDALIRELMLWRGNLRIRPEHFTGWSRGNRFYSILYMLTRVGEAQDWGSGLPLKKGLLGKNTSLEVHHIFPRDFLKKNGHDDKKAINALGNFCFLTKNSNLQISNRPPQAYFPEVESQHPGALASQWIPQDRELWKPENYAEFLRQRQALLADAANTFLDTLYQLPPEDSVTGYQVIEQGESALGGIADAEEEKALDEVNAWITDRGLPAGEKEFELRDPDTGELKAFLDLAWPEGLQEGLSEPTALVLNEELEVFKLATNVGFQVFDDAEEFRVYAARKVLGDLHYGLPEWAQQVDEAAIPVVNHILKSDLPVPECGGEIQMGTGEVAGEFEFVWDDHRVAVGVSDERAPHRAMLAAQGWRLFSLDEVVELPRLLEVALESDLGGSQS